MTTTQISGVTVATQANVYFDGKCVSHSLTLADGTKQSVGVILPATLTFNTGAPEVMECVAGGCEYLLAGKELTRLEAMVLFAVPDLTKIISDLRREGYEVKRRTLPYAAALRRVNEVASLTPPPALPVSDITLTEYWVSR